MQVTASRSDAITQRRTSPRIQTPPPPPPVSEPAQRSIAVRDEAFAFPEHELLMSTTDRTGRITHCNAAFCHVSGYSMDELMGQPHNIVRHSDMPAEAFKDMWATIGHGRTWTGLVKNLRKDGRYYWVRAYVTPIMEGGKPRGYMSVRVKPTDGEVRAATALYARFRQGTQGSLYLHAGHVRRRGLFQHFNQLQRANFTQRLLGLLTPLLQDVTTAADAQSQGIAQVNDALHDLDTVTQANAQLAEVSAQSAHHMDAHAGILRRTLDIFRL